MFRRSASRASAFKTGFALTTAASILFATTIAAAHDPRFHEPEEQMPPAKAKPTTCAQLADSRRYSNDLTDPDIKALKARCDAEKAAAARKATAQAKK